MKRFLTDTLIVLIYIYNATGIVAQTCDGTKGKPIFYQTFGSGVPLFSTASPVSFGFKTTYNQVFSVVGGHPNDGEFAFVNSIPNPFNKWQLGWKDHTGNQNGYMMLVNADYNPDEFFRDTIHSLCAGSSYDFSVWIANVYSASNGILPNVKFEIRSLTNALIATYSTGNIAFNAISEWSHFGFTFTSPQNDIILLLINNNPGGQGNDLALDDIMLVPCTPTINVPKINKYCVGSNIVIQSNPGSTFQYVNPQYQWQKFDGSNWNDITSAITSAFLIPNAGLSDSGLYRILVAEPGNITSEYCRSVDSLQIFINPLPTITANSKTVCVGLAATLSGIGAVSYSWDAGISDNTIFTPSATKTYTVTGIDSHGCQNTASTTVMVNALPTIGANLPTVCLGQTTKLVATGANSYEWDGGIFNNSIFTPTATNTFTVTGTDGNGCQNTMSTTVTVYSLPNIGSNSPTICFGQSTKLSATGARSYSWNGGIDDNSVFTPSQTKTYMVTGTDGNGCQNTGTAKVTVLDLPIITATIPTLCLNQTTSLSGKGAVSYSWDGGISDNTIFTPSATKTYTVTGTDSHGCRNTATTTVTVNALPTIGANLPTLCLGQTAKLVGTGANSYVWDGGIFNNTVFTPTATNTFTVTGTDGNGCKNTASTTVTVNALPTIGSNSPTICFGQSTKLSATGARSYSWNGGIDDNSVFTPSQTKTYMVTGTDGNGCQNTGTAKVMVLDLPIITATIPTLCLNQTTSLSGKGAVSYSWDGGISDNTIFTPSATKTYTVTGTDSHGCRNTATTTVTVNALPTIGANLPTLCLGQTAKLVGTGANSYIWDGGIFNNSVFTPTATNTFTVTGTDGNGCKNTASTTVTVNALPTIGSNSPTICYGQSTKLSATGARSYSWNGGIDDNGVFTPSQTKTYTVTGTDGNGCQNTGTAKVMVLDLPIITATIPTLCLHQTTSLSGKGAVSYSWDGGISDNTIFTPSATKTYTVTGTDSHGCRNTATTTVTVNALPTIGANLPTVCLGQTTKLVGTGANSYVWDGGIINNTLFTPTATKIYYVTGTDGNGCKNTASTTVIVNTLPTIRANSPTICFGQSTKLSATGARSYSWNGGIDDNSVFTPSKTTSYTVTGIDDNGCQNTSSAKVTVLDLPIITANIPTLCLHQTTSLSGKGAVSYSWDGGISDNTIFTPSVTKTYSVTGTDSHGCQNTATTTVTVNALPTIGANLPTLCLGQTTKLVGTGANSYVWNGGIFNNTVFTPTATNTFTVTGTDGNGCKNTASTTVTVNALPTIGSNSPTICYGQSTKLSATGARSYSWNGGIDNNSVFTPSQTTSYTVTGTDDNGCQNRGSATVTVNHLPTITALSSTICYNDQVKLTAMGANSYNWDNGVYNAVYFTPTVTNSYTVTGTDGNGCQNTASATVTVNQLPVLTYKPISPVCEYSESVSINKAIPVGGTYSGLGVSDTIFDVAKAGVGVHTITYVYIDENYCKNSTTQTITVNPKPVITFNLDSVRCYDAGLLQLTASPVGGMFTGIGVSGKNFDPTIPVSETVVPISYGYTIPSTGCTDTVTKAITVHYTPPPVVYNVQTSLIDLQTSIHAIGSGTIRWYDDGGLNLKLLEGNPYYHGYTTEIVRYYYITQVINGCESKADTMKLKIVSCGTPAPIVNSPTLKCMYDLLEPVTVSNVMVGTKTAKVIWRDKYDAIVSNSNPYTPIFTHEGTITYQVSLDTSGCEGAGVPVTWLRYKTPQPIVAPVAPHCEGLENFQFNATNSYGTVKWYYDLSLDSLLATGKSFVPSIGKAGSHAFWVTNNDICISDPVEIHLLIYPKPTAPYGDTLYQSCQGAAIETMSVKPVIGTSWYNAKNSLIGTDLSAYTPPLATLQLNQRVSYSTINFDGHCYSDPFVFNYLLKQKPPKPKLHADTICMGSRTTLKVDSGFNLTWHFPSLNKDYTGLRVQPDITESGIYTYSVFDELHGCKSDVATDSVIVGPTPYNGILGPDKICVNATKMPFGVTSHHPKSSYVWKVTGNRVIYKSTESVQYYCSIDFIKEGIDTIYVTETNEYGCSATDSSVIRIAPYPSANFIYDVPNENSRYEFTNTSDSLYITDGSYKELLPLAFKWNFGHESDTLIPQSWAQFKQETVYKEFYPYGYYTIMLMVNPVGFNCPDLISKRIYVDLKEALYIPNAFCPDHSSPNLGVFTAKGFNLKTFKMWIYDYWGNLLWYTDKLYNGQPLEGWDGRINGVIQKVDSYVWKVEAEFNDGVIWEGQTQTGASGNKKSTFGNVMLMR